LAGAIQQFGSVLFTQSTSEETYKEIVRGLNLKPPIIVKPNWSGSEIFTESEILDWTLTALDSDAIVVESYAHYRHRLIVEHEGLSDEEIERRVSKQKKDDLRHYDSWFLDFTGNRAVLQRHGVEYLNISEELWAGRVCEEDEIRGVVDEQYGPLSDDRFYSMVPTRLFELRGGSLLSLAKPKIAFEDVRVSLSIKNLFGMIATPYRGKFHGTDNSILNESILNISKIYASIFNLSGILEGVFTTSVSRKDGFIRRIITSPGIISASSSIVDLDAFACVQLGVNPNEVNHISKAADTFGEWDIQVIEGGKQFPLNF
jgi:hypothetical protein